MFQLTYHPIGTISNGETFISFLIELVFSTYYLYEHSRDRVKMKVIMY